MELKIIAAALLAGAAIGASAAEINVAVAANFTAPAKELAADYEKATGDKLVDRKSVV